MKLRLVLVGLMLAGFVTSVIVIRSMRVTPQTSALPASVLSQTAVASVSATLTIDRGMALIKSDNQWHAGTDGQMLYQGDSVKTNPGSQASLVFINIGELRLEQQTEITLTTLTPIAVHVYQTIGDTYSKVKKLFDPASSYEVETPTAVASVRGTAFGVLVDALQESRVVVSENIVDVAPIVREGEIRTRLPAASVRENEGTIVNQETITQSAATRLAPPVLPKTIVLPQEKTIWIEQNRQKDRDFDQKNQEEILQTIQGASSGSAQPIPALNNCTGDACVVLCGKPENRDRCQRVVQEKQQEIQQDKEQQEQREKGDQKPAPLTSAVVSPTPTNNPIQQIIQPIRDAIERIISPSPKPPEPGNSLPIPLPTASGQSVTIRDDQKENEKEKEREKEKEKEKEKESEKENAKPSPSSEDEKKSLRDPSL